MVNILAEPIKNDLGLADWQLGLMSGLAFAIFYTVLGIPIARLAERKNRPIIIGTAVAVVRIHRPFGHGSELRAVGSVPDWRRRRRSRLHAARPLADRRLRAEEKRASALAFYSMGTPLGGLLGLVMGGLIADAYGWRVAFFVAGARASSSPCSAGSPSRSLASRSPNIRPPFRRPGELRRDPEVPRHQEDLLAHRARRGDQGVHRLRPRPFTASFFLRVHGEEVAGLASMFNLQSIGFLGLALGLMGGTAGAISAYLGGQIADRYAKKDLRGYVSVPAIASLLAVPIYIIAVSVPSASVALWIW